MNFWLTPLIILGELCEGSYNESVKFSTDVCRPLASWLRGLEVSTICKILCGHNFAVLSMILCPELHLQVRLQRCWIQQGSHLLCPSGFAVFDPCQGGICFPGCLGILPAHSCWVLVDQHPPIPFCSHSFSHLCFCLCNLLLWGWIVLGKSPRLCQTLRRWCMILKPAGVDWLTSYFSGLVFFGTDTT